ncbi:TetR/AcrR family transcriptional regulator [Amycolatopsis thermalba]|uniref:TetR/AcrR family transcriptional regulator n=1 Tax=Amycolatopsis thermalba TaxID=944492 RepID=A0ABY4NUC7_9PSEU|nr:MULTISPECIES: TetR family transcriptional regulator [Amycolatopsis]OXM72891.1 hypothetical protein CF166_12830 [Amycolatopsis sp. KNN50.9b]UQS23676.1 TetR/AcrR family transcriptional regulator [Amycolatopsis thermalba]
MGRSSLAAERKEQILSAFARCVARSGFARTSLEDVAAESGLARGHVRHYLGNRHDQVAALAEWINAPGREAFDRVRGIDDDRKRADGVLDYLFHPGFYGPSDELAVFLALFEEARRTEDLRKKFVDEYHDILDTLTGALMGGHALPKREASDIAYLMLCAAVGNAHLSETGVSPVRARRVGGLCRRVLRMLLPANGKSAAGS